MINNLRSEAFREQLMKSFREFLCEDLKPHPVEKMRDYTDSEFKWEWREYDKYHRHLFPNAFKDEAHLRSEYDKAPLRHLTPHEFRNLEYSTAAHYVGKDKEKMEQHVRDDMGHRRNLDRIYDHMYKSKMAPPIVLKHSKGMRIMGGNTRLSAGAAHGLSIPVKVIDISDRH